MNSLNSTCRCQVVGGLMDTCAICSEIRPLIALVPCSLAVMSGNWGMPSGANLFSLWFRLLVHFRVNHPNHPLATWPTRGGHVICAECHAKRNSQRCPFCRKVVRCTTQGLFFPWCFGIDRDRMVSIRLVFSAVSIKERLRSRTAQRLI